MGELIMPTTSRQDADFADELRSNGFHDATWVLVWVGQNFNPDDVFDTDQLADWAEENGYVLKGDE